MANPSLQIGNSNWAIKEDNLLGYSTAGTRFLPQPITMTRASAGTRVNPQGLVETVELLGSELVTDGDFPTGTTAWIRQSNWTIGGGKATVTLGNNGDDMLQDIGIVSGKTYKIEVTISNWSAGSLRMNLLGTGGDIGDFSADGTYVGYAIGGNDSRLQIAAKTTTTTLSIDNVSVKESTKNNLARVDYDGTASSLLVEPERTNLLTYSEDFSNAVWSEVSGGSASNPVLTNDYAISPDGTQNATRCLFDMGGGTTTSDYSRLRYLNLTATTPLISIYIKSNNATTYQLNLSYGGDALFLVDAKPNEWTRVDKLTTASGSFDYRLELRGTKTSDDIADVLIWGAQAEEGSYGTSYIPTSGSTVTRNQDIFTRDGIGSLINSTEGVLFLEVAALSLLSDVSRVIMLTSSDGLNYVNIYFQSDGRLTVYNNVNGVNTVLFQQVLNDITLFNKCALKWGSQGYELWVNGIKLESSTSTSVPIGLSEINFNWNGGIRHFYGKVKQLQVYDTSLSDTQLAALTS